MHEMAVTEQVLEIALKKAEENRASEIQAINLVIGDLTSFIDDSLQFCFDIISKNTIAKNAKLTIKRVPLELCCRNCQQTFNPHTEAWQCPRCHGWEVEITGGQEFYMDSIEVP